jgi:hypothetical protein
MVIQEDDVGMMPPVSVDCFEARSDNFDDLVLAPANELRQGCADIPLVIRDQNPHGGKMAEGAVPAERISSRAPLALWRVTGKVKRA